MTQLSFPSSSGQRTSGNTQSNLLLEAVAAAQGCSSSALSICKDAELITPLGIRAGVGPP